MRWTSGLFFFCEVVGSSLYWANWVQLLKGLFSYSPIYSDLYSSIYLSIYFVEEEKRSRFLLTGNFSKNRIFTWQNSSLPKFFPKVSFSENAPRSVSAGRHLCAGSNPKATWLGRGFLVKPEDKSHLTMVRR